MKKEMMLENLQKERPLQVIHKVLGINENEYGFFDVNVDMEINFFGTIIRHVHQVLPYPYAEYEKLNEKQKLDWRWKKV